MLDKNVFQKRCIEHIDNIVNMSGGRDLWIYGAGEGGDILLKAFKNSNIKCKGYIDEKFMQIKTKNELPVKWFDSLDRKKDYLA